MRRWFFSFFAILFCQISAHAGQASGKPVLELWDAVYLEGGKAGYVNTTVTELDRAGKKVLRTSVDLRLTLKKNQQTVQLNAQTGTEEAPDGTVLGTFMHQGLGTRKQVSITGTVKGNQLDLLLDGKAGVMAPAPWNSRVVGLFHQQNLMAEKNVKPGDSFNYLSFEPTVNLVVQMNVAVKDYEEVELMGKHKSKLLRVEVASEKLEGVSLPKLVTWLDDQRKTVRQDTEIPGIGRITMYRTSRDIALAPGPQATLTDIGFSQVVRLKQKVLRPLDATSAVYRITVKGDADAASAFSADERQKIMNTRGATFEMQVTAQKTPKKTVAGTKPGEEYSQSSYFINSADARVKELARKAVGRETDPIRKAQQIEKWVNLNMRNTNLELMAPADQVARSLEGDCSEFAMLMTAMCRAEGVPAKTAMGLVYADTQGGPVFAFHMWTEVWVLGQWLPLDATLGRGYVGATHIKVTDHSWHEMPVLTPLLPLSRVLGKLEVEIVSVK